MAKETQSASTKTIRLHRVLRAAPEKVYRAFLDAEAMAKWLPPNGYTAEVLPSQRRHPGRCRTHTALSPRSRKTGRDVQTEPVKPKRGSTRHTNCRPRVRK